MQTEEALIYLNQIKRLGIIPNFWSTLEYLEYQDDMKLESNDRAIWIQEEDVAVFPPIPKDGNLGDLKGYPDIKIWSDFPNFSIGVPEEFVDLEYTYLANSFRELSGKQWATFRKNVRKWPRNNEYQYEVIDKDTEKLLIEWLESRPDSIIEDDQTLIKFVTKGRNRAFLTSKNELVGVNVWEQFDDEYVIYRYCIAKPEEPFLDEFLRYLFYLSIPDKIVIDGGVLGNPGLERFKDRLNPFQKRAVFSRMIY
jgi:hypothetical protein